MKKQENLSETIGFDKFMCEICENWFRFFFINFTNLINAIHRNQWCLLRFSLMFTVVRTSRSIKKVRTLEQHFILYITGAAKIFEKDYKIEPRVSPGEAKIGPRCTPKYSEKQVAKTKKRTGPGKPNANGSKMGANI